MKYPKINTIWKRDRHGKIIPGDYSKNEIPNIKHWHITEKIHGRNTRIEYHVKIKSGVIDITSIELKGKTDNADIPSILVNYLNNLFTIERLSRVPIPRVDKETNKPIDEEYDITLFGEGYGAKIQKGGGRYRDDPSFILFEVNINGWWLEPDNVKDIANRLEIDYVPELGIMDNDDAINIVKNQQPCSKISQDKTLLIEGIVARAHPMVLFRDGTPIMWKLKLKDFKR